MKPISKAAQRAAACESKITGSPQLIRSDGAGRLFFHDTLPSPARANPVPPLWAGSGQGWPVGTVGHLGCHPDYFCFVGRQARSVRQALSLAAGPSGGLPGHGAGGNPLTAPSHKLNELRLSGTGESWRADCRPLWPRGIFGMQVTCAQFPRRNTGG